MELKLDMFSIMLYSITLALVIAIIFGIINTFYNTNDFPKFQDYCKSLGYESGIDKSIGRLTSSNSLACYKHTFTRWGGNETEYCYVTHQEVFGQ